MEEKTIYVVQLTDFNWANGLSAELYGSSSDSRKHMHGYLLFMLKCLAFCVGKENCLGPRSSVLLGMAESANLRVPSLVVCRARCFGNWCRQKPNLSE